MGCVGEGIVRVRVIRRIGALDSVWNGVGDNSADQDGFVDLANNEVLTTEL